ncbi:MAG: phosphoribosylformylglycinamidine synthase I [Candidatus Omnitrophota bacterium]
MKTIKTLILRTAGTNCDLETEHALRLAGSQTELMHIKELKRKKNSLKSFHILAIPGGFTYGDDVASGKILANEIRSALKKEICSFVSEGKLVIGICNGFQVLVKMGLLPGLSRSEKFQVDATLSLNDSGKFIAKWVYLKNESFGSNKNGLSVWTRDLPEVIALPIAHAEGKFIMKDTVSLKTLKNKGQVAFRYSDISGNIGASEVNPNGSEDNIAGICDATGRILGLMPHPERHVSSLQHPNWRRKEFAGEATGSGLQIFKSGVDFARRNL